MGLKEAYYSKHTLQILPPNWSLWQGPQPFTRWKPFKLILSHSYRCWSSVGAYSNGQRIAPCPGVGRFYDLLPGSMLNVKNKKGIL